MRVTSTPPIRARLPPPAAAFLPDIFIFVSNTCGVSGPDASPRGPCSSGPARHRASREASTPRAVFTVCVHRDGSLHPGATLAQQAHSRESSTGDLRLSSGTLGTAISFQGFFETWILTELWGMGLVMIFRGRLSLGPIGGLL